MKILLLVSLLAISCTAPFKGGRYFQPQDLNVPAVGRHIFRENGQFVSYLVLPRGVSDTVERGRWQTEKKMVKVVIDTVYPYKKDPRRVNILSNYKIKDKGSKLILRKKLNGKRYKTVLIQE